MTADPRVPFMIVVRDDRYHLSDAAAGPYTISETVLLARRQTRGHSHEHDEVYWFRGGRAQMTVGDDSFEVDADVVVYVPPNAYHRVESLGTIVEFLTFFVGEPARPEV